VRTTDIKSIWRFAFVLSCGFKGGGGVNGGYFNFILVTHIHTQQLSEAVAYIFKISVSNLD
jgi:hypothetical protein